MITKCYQRLVRFGCSVAVGFALLTSCQFEGDEQGDDETVEELSIKQAVLDSLKIISNIEDDLSKNLMLVDATQRDRDYFIDILERIKIALYRLKKYPGSADAMDDLKANLVLFNKISFFNEDIFHIDALRSSLDNVVTNLLYVVEFSEGISDFQEISIQGAGKWQPELGRGYIKLSNFQKGPMDHWLISPRFDLSSTQNPVLEFRQAVGFLMDWGDLEVLVAVDYQGEDPQKVAWTPLSIDVKPPVPDTKENRWKWYTSEEVSLDAFSEKPVVVAFHFAPKDKREPTWELQYIKLKGKGDLIREEWRRAESLEPAVPEPNQGSKQNPQNVDPVVKNPEENPSEKAPPALDPVNPVDPAPKVDAEPNLKPEDGRQGAEDKDSNVPKGEETTLFLETFTDSMGAFQDYNERGKASWRQAIYQEDAYVRISGFKQGRNKNWLLSPVFDLSQAIDVSLTVKQKYGHYVSGSVNMSIMVSDNYNGGDPNLAKWTSVNFKDLPQNSDDPSEKFTPWAQSDEVLLSNLVTGNQVAIAFIYTCEAENAPVWDIDQMELRGSGTLGVVKIQVPKAPESPPVSQ